jgi:hypothetical protein
VAGSTKNRLACDTEMSGPSKDERRELLRAFRKLMPQKRGENENVGSSGKMRRRHQALFASFRDAKSISGSKVECLRLIVVGYTIFQGSWRVSELSMPRRRCLSRSYNVTKEVSMPYPKSQIQIRYARERGP